MLVKGMEGREGVGRAEEGVGEAVVGGNQKNYITGPLLGLTPFT
jgi:hypothetical protein